MTKTCPDCDAMVHSTSQPDIIGVLKSVHSALDDALGDTDMSHIESDDDLRDVAPVQWAAQWLAHAIETMEGSPAALAAAPAVGGEDARTEALRVISTMAICEEGETAEQRALIVDACREVAANALAAQPASPLRGITEEQLAQLVMNTQECGKGDRDEAGNFQKMYCDDDSLSRYDGRSDVCQCKNTVKAILASSPASPLRGRESVRKIAHRHCTCTCRDDPEVLQNHTNLCDEISDAILEYAALFSAAPEQPALIGGSESCTCHFLGTGTHHVPGCPFYKIITTFSSLPGQPAATPDIVKMYADAERAKNARIGELEEALGKAVLSAPLVRQLTENERDAIAHAKYQCDCSSPSDPEVRFDYEVIRTLLSLIPVPKEAT